MTTTATVAVTIMMMRMPILRICAREGHSLHSHRRRRWVMRAVAVLVPRIVSVLFAGAAAAAALMHHPDDLKKSVQDNSPLVLVNIVAVVKEPFFPRVVFALCRWRQPSKKYEHAKGSGGSQQPVKLRTGSEAARFLLRSLTVVPVHTVPGTVRTRFYPTSHHSIILIHDRVIRKLFSGRPNDGEQVLFPKQ